MEFGGNMSNSQLNSHLIHSVQVADAKLNKIISTTVPNQVNITLTAHKYCCCCP